MPQPNFTINWKTLGYLLTKYKYVIVQIDW